MAFTGAEVWVDLESGWEPSPLQKGGLGFRVQRLGFTGLGG